MKITSELEKEFIIAEAQKCLLCYDAPCSKVCPHKAEPSKFIRSIHLDNIDGAVYHVEKSGLGADCVENCTEKYCEKACVRRKINDALQIHRIHLYLENEKEEA